MREIKTLMAELRNYPNNLFVYPLDEKDSDLLRLTIPRHGLVVCDLIGEEQGFIELGTDNRQVVI